MNLFDIMKQAGGGDAFARLATLYGLSEEQVRQAAEAFLPAFSAGLKKRTSDPMGMMELMQKMALGNFQRAFENPAFAAAAGRRDGEDTLSFLFGSPAVAEAVAKQASEFTGLAQQKFLELMPSLATMMLGGLAEKSAAANPLFDAMLKEFRASATAQPAAGKGPLDRYEEEQAERESESSGAAELKRTQERMMEAGLASFEAGSAAWRKALGDMMSAPGGGAVTGNAAQPETEATGRDVFGSMLEPGVRLGEAYRREMEALLDTLGPGASRK